jgi:outer membrane protein TolC
MIFAVLTEKRVSSVLLVCSLVAVCALAGCATDPSKYKAEADEKVYGIIEQKWTDDLPGPANYRISDVTPGPNDIKIERVVPSDGVLTLPQAVAMATAHNRQYQLEKEALYVMALDLRLARHEFEAYIFGGGSVGYTKLRGKEGVHIATGTPDVGQLTGNPDRIDAVGFNISDIDVDPDGTITIRDVDIDTVVDDADRIDFGADMLESHGGAGAGIGFSQLLATGARISGNIAINWVRILTGDLDGGLVTSVLGAAITQPLLRGSDRRVVLENLTQAERDTLYQIRTFNRFRKTFVISIISQYYWVLKQLDMARNAEENYHRLLGIEQKLEHLTSAGKLPRNELQQAHQDTLSALDTYIKAQKLYKQALDEFKLQLSLPTNSQLQLDENELAVLAAAEMDAPDFSEDEALESALNERLDLANSADAISDAEHKILVAADNLRPELNLLTTASVPLRQLSTSEARTLRDVFAGSLQLDLNLDKELEKNVYRKSLITLDQQKRTYEETTDIVVLQVRQAYRDLLEAAQSYRIQSESLQLAQKRFNDTTLLMQYGRASGRRVLDAQKDLFRSQNAATEALVNYTIATLNFYRDTGVLQVRPDGMWQRPKGVEEETEPDVLEITEDLFRPETEGRQLDTEEFIDRWMTKTEIKTDNQSDQSAPLYRDAEEYIDQWMKKSTPGKLGPISHQLGTGR